MYDFPKIVEQDGDLVTFKFLDKVNCKYLNFVEVKNGTTYELYVDRYMIDERIAKDKNVLKFELDDSSKRHQP